MLTLPRRLVVTALALTGALTCVAGASAAQATQYGGTSSQKVGGSSVRLTLTVSHGAVSNVQVAALVTKGAAICAVNVGGSSFVFSKGKAKINRSHKFSGKLTDGHGDSMTITGLAKPARVTGSFVIKSTGGASGATTCNSGKVRFSAQAGGGQATTPSTRAWSEPDSRSASACPRTGKRSTTSSCTTKSPPAAALPATRRRRTASTPSRSSPAASADP